MRTMKDSRVAWIGEIPEEWEIKKARFLFQQRLTKGSKSGVLLASTQQYGIIPQYKIEGAVKVKEDTDLQLFKSVEKNDFVISLRSFQGGIEHSEYEGVCSPAYQVFFNVTPLNHYFFKYLFKSHKFISILNSLSLGIRDGKNIQYKDLAGLYLPFPPLTEQQRIADYLDAKCAEIDNSMELVRQGIDKLKEYKKSVITEAVTKGLDPDVPMRDSGVPWIGQIPEGWILCKLKRICNIIDGDRGKNYPNQEDFTSKGVPFMTTSSVYSKYVDITNCKYINKDKYNMLGSGKLKKFDIIISVRGSIGNSCIFNQENGFINAQLMILRSINIDVNFLYYITQSSYWKKNLELFSYGTAQQQLSNFILSNIDLIYPPIFEQHRIAAYLDAKCAEIDALITQEQALLDKLAEYKKSLIFECVTGKREVAA